MSSRDRNLTILRVSLFWLLSAFARVLFSGLLQPAITEWKQHLFLSLAIIATYGLSIVFARWQGISLIRIGIVADNATFKKLSVGVGIGLLMAVLQLAFVLLRGHYRTSVSNSVSLYSVFFYFTLYFLVSLREELAFRGFHYLL